jgi:hypothetical protein
MSFRVSVRRISGVICVLGVLLALVVPAAASTINGTLTITPALGRQVAQAEQEQLGALKLFFWRVPNGAVATSDPIVNPTRDLAVVLETAEGQAPAPAGPVKVIDLRGGELRPSVSVVTPHTKVRFRNTDAFVYDLRCAENSQMIQGQVLPPGQQVDYPFDTEGTFRITDRRHPYLQGWVVVTGSANAKNPEPGKAPDQAAFTFENIAPGRYLLKVFHAGSWVAQQEVAVEEGQTETGVQISLPADSQPGQQAEGAPAPDGATATKQAGQ